MKVDTSERTLRAGLIGAGIQHSASPALHMDEGRSAGLNYSYELFDLDLAVGREQALPEVLREAEQRGLTGVNITFPCKQSVIPLLDDLSADASQLGSVNTVLFRDGRRSGHNTDWWGFAESFKRGLPDAFLRQVALIGAGGAGAAVGYAALKLGAGELRIFDRESERSAALALRLQEMFADRRVIAELRIDPALAGVDGMIHATPTGMLKLPGMPVPPHLLRPPMWVADVVYVPLHTALLSAAVQQGCRVLDGGGMAVFQAVKAFELFTGVVPDAQRMLKQFSTRQATAAA